MLSDRRILISSSEFLVLSGGNLWCLAQPVVTSVGSPVSTKAKRTTTQFRFVCILCGSTSSESCEPTGPRISRRVVLECCPYRHLFRSCQSQGYKHPNATSRCSSQSTAENATSRAEPCCAFRCCLFGPRHSTQ